MKASAIDLLASVTTVSVETQAIVEAMKAEAHGKYPLDKGHRKA